MERGCDENLEKGAAGSDDGYKIKTRVFVRFCSATSSIAAAHGLSLSNRLFNRPKTIQKSGGYQDNSHLAQ